MNDLLSMPPVAIFAFNRPECVEKVFDAVRKAKPQQLFLCMDAPREGNVDDVKKCEKVRQVFDGVDWDCDVYRNYAERNMGCRSRMASGITWVFEHVEEAILLEDDCVPHQDFFCFCAELLELYRHDTRIGMISGHIAHFKPVEKEASYYFDRYPTICGWATWKRAWQSFNGDLSEWPRLRNSSFLYSVFRKPATVSNVKGFFEGVFAGEANSWATIWWLSMIRQNYLCIHPSKNLITNIGVQGAHNNGATDWHGIPSNGIEFPLTHPRDIMPDFDEELVMEQLYTKKSWCSRALHKLKGIIRMERKKLS
jgi:hypothetical protein